MNQNTQEDNSNQRHAIDSRIVSHGTGSHGRVPQYELGEVSSADVRRSRIRTAKRGAYVAGAAGLAYLGYGTDFINISGPENNVQDHLDNIPGAQQDYDNWVENKLPENPAEIRVEIPVDQGQN